MPNLAWFEGLNWIYGNCPRKLPRLPMSLARKFSFNFHTMWAFSHKGLKLKQWATSDTISFQYNGYDILIPILELFWYWSDCTVYVSVGGIYTVIRSKAYVSTEEMGDQYCLFGPYKETCARTEVEEQEFPPGSALQIAVSRMRDRGFQVF